jgi:hypothetical protein
MEITDLTNDDKDSSIGLALIQTNSEFIDWDNQALYLEILGVTTTSIFDGVFSLELSQSSVYDIYLTSDDDSFVLGVHDATGSTIEVKENYVYGGDGSAILINFSVEESGIYYFSNSGIDEDTSYLSLGVYEYTDSDLSPQDLYSVTPEGFAKGTAGDDQFLANYSSIILGGEGIDRIVFNYNLSDVTIDLSGVNQFITTSEGVQTFSGVERIIGLDTNLALDINGNAGIVAKVIGAVFGADALSNKEYVGIGLGLLDEGKTYAELMELAINVKIGINPDYATTVEALYQNVTGFSPEINIIDQYVSALNNGEYSISSLGVLAAETATNLENINFTGLGLTGIEYF